ncbi:MAG: VanZ family protein [Bacteroidia bacterium]|nr:VanZ family protein [Bacteroidia bacterium]
MKKIILRYPEFTSLVWTHLIFLLCATPGRYIPTANWLEILSFDKLVHAGIFFVLCSLLILVTLKKQQGKTWIVIYLLGGILYGASLEWMQANVFSERSADWLDICANTFGCLLSLFFLRKYRALAKEN